jgi:uncharacterized protein (DUF2336 family)
VQCAVARRARVPVSIAAAIAEVGSAAAALELIENPGADLAPLSWERIVERHGHLAAIRESMLALDDLPAATRSALIGKLSDTLAQFVVAKNWLSADRSGRAVSDARDRSIVNIAARARDDDMRGLVAHLRTTGQLTAGLILRALLSGNHDLFDHALVELSGLPLSRVAALVHDRGGASLPALLTRAGLPKSTFPAFRAALEARDEIGFVGTVGGATRLRRRMVERVLTMCETASTEVSEPLLILLRRFATESAREEARVFCDELVAEAAAEPAYDEVPVCEPEVCEPLAFEYQIDEPEPSEFEPCEPEPFQVESYAIEPCEPERYEPRFDSRREPSFDEPEPCPPRHREPLLSDLLAAA